MQLRDLKPSLLKALMPDEPMGKWSVQLLHGGSCFGRLDDMPFASASNGTVDVQALLAPIDELLFEGTFTFPEAGRKVECKVWKRWCASTLETRSASTVTGCWRSDTFSLCYVFNEHQLKPRLREDEYLGEPAIDAEASFPRFSGKLASRTRALAIILSTSVSTPYSLARAL